MGFLDRIASGQQHEANAKALADPQPGDFWCEFLMGVCLVVARVGEHVCICRERQECDARHYVFVNPEWMTLEEFRTWLSYGSIPGCWADIFKRGWDVSSYADAIPQCPDEAPHPPRPGQRGRGRVMAVFRVGTFIHHRGEGRRPFILAYLRDYHPSWEGCVEYDIEAKSGAEAKKIAERRRREHEGLTPPGAAP